MNEVKKCSLSGIAFTMDIEAYNELSNYLETLKKNYKESADGAEIVADIEARIAELILSTQDHGRVVELPLVRNIIAQMGTPEDIAGDEEPEPQHSSADRNPRRLYRDTQHAKLGGVCAGIGKYFDIDPAWVRLCCFLPLLLNCFSWVPLFHWLSPLTGNLLAVIVICYMVMWFAIPVARTARQKLEMNGERITADTISRSAAAKDPDATAKTVVADTVSVFGKVVLILLKLFASVIVFGLVMGVVALLIGLIAILIGSHEFVPNDIALSIPILGIFIALIPMMMLLYSLMCLIASRRPNGKSILVMFLIWILTIIACATVAIYDQALPKASEHFEKNWDEVMAPEVEIDGQTNTVKELLEEIDDTEKPQVNGTVKINPDRQTAKLTAETQEAIEALQEMEGVKITINDTDANPKKISIESRGKQIMEVEIHE